VGPLRCAKWYSIVRKYHMQWYYAWWPWLTYEGVARVCQHHLSFSLYTLYALMAKPCFATYFPHVRKIGNRKSYGQECPVFPHSYLTWFFWCIPCDISFEHVLCHARLLSGTHYLWVGLPGVRFWTGLSVFGATCPVENFSSNRTQIIYRYIRYICIQIQTLNFWLPHEVWK